MRKLGRRAGHNIMMYCVNYGDQMETLRPQFSYASQLKIDFIMTS